MTASSLDQFVHAFNQSPLKANKPLHCFAITEMAGDATCRVRFFVTRDIHGEALFARMAEALLPFSPTKDAIAGGTPILVAPDHPDATTSFGVSHISINGHHDILEMTLPEERLPELRQRFEELLTPARSLAR